MNITVVEFKVTAHTKLGYNAIISGNFGPEIHDSLSMCHKDVSYCGINESANQMRSLNC